MKHGRATNFRGYLFRIVIYESINFPQQRGSKYYLRGSRFGTQWQKYLLLLEYKWRIQMLWLR